MPENSISTKYLLASRAYGLFIALLFIVITQIHYSGLAVFVISIILLESFFVFWRTKSWWGKADKVAVLSDWESKTFVALFGAAVIWGIVLILNLNAIVPVWVFTIVSFLFALLLLYGELIRRIQILSRDLLILMPDKRNAPSSNNHHINRMRDVKQEEDIVLLINQARKEGKKVRVLGNRNSSKVYREAPTGEGEVIQIELAAHYNQLLHIDKENKRLTIQSGMTQGALVEILKEHNWALNALNGTYHTTVGGIIATGSLSAAKYTFNEAIISMTVIDAYGHILTIDRTQEEFGAYLASNGLLGVLSTITLQCVEEYGVRGKSSVLSFDNMLDLVDEDGLHFFKDWDYVVCEWYPQLDKVISRRVKQTEHNKANNSKDISAVGPSESYFAQLLTVIGDVVPLANKLVISAYIKYLGIEFGDGFWATRISADPELSLSFHPIDYIEIVVPVSSYISYMKDLRSYYLDYPDRMPYGPVVTDWITADKLTWIGKNSFDQEEWFGAIMFIRQHVEKKSTEFIFEGPIELGKKHHARMHWGKDPWLHTKEDLANSLPAGNLERFCELRKRNDPDGMFMNDFFEKIIT